MARALGARLCVEGVAPAPGALLVANHVFWLDILAIASCRPAIFVAKSEVRDWPAIGWLASRAQALFLNVRAGALAAGQEPHCSAAARAPQRRDLSGRHHQRRLERSAVSSRTAAGRRDSARPVQPVAIAYCSDEGNPCPDAAFIDA